MAKFRMPQAGISLFCLFLFCLTSALGVWQHERAKLKDLLQAEAEAKLLGASVPLASLDPQNSQELVYTPVFAVGSYEREAQFLIDNRVRDKRPGYHVIAPLKLEDGGHVLVNRGWIPAGVSRETPALPEVAAGAQTVYGHLAADSGDAFVLGEDTGAGGVFLKLRIDAWQQRTGKQAFPLVLLSGAAERGLLPVTVAPDFKADRSRGYRLQWFMLALVALCGWIAFGLKRQGQGDAQG